MTMNSSHTPMLPQQWAILPEWAIGTVVGFVVVTIGAIAYFGGRDRLAIFMYSLKKRWFGGAR